MIEEITTLEPPLEGAGPDQEKEMADWSTYRVFGVTVHTNFSLVQRGAVATTGQADLTISCDVVDELPERWRDAETVFESQMQVDGGSFLRAYRRADGFLFRFRNLADFYVWPDRMDVYQLEGASKQVLDIYFTGTVLAFWIAQKGIPALHSSAVVVNGGAVAFLANSTAGKSSLAASLVKKGYPLLTDDVLPVRNQNGQAWGQPGYPNMRMWPPAAEHFVGEYAHFPLVHPKADKRYVTIGEQGFGSFCADPRPLKCLYVPYRYEPNDSNEVTFEPIEPREATIELIRYAYMDRWLVPFGMQPGYLKAVAEIVKQVPVRRVYYPSGYERLDAVCDRILADVAAL